MNLAYKKILGKFTKVLGFGKTPPPCWEKFPNDIVFFLRAYLTPVILQKLVKNIASLNLANYPERLIFGLILQNFTPSSSKFYTRAAPDVCHKFQVCFICYFGCQQSTSQRRVGLMPHPRKVEHANGGL